MSVRRINQHLAEIDADQKAAHLRPNEAQLGWAHFHRVARAEATKRRIERLMNFPPNISDVEGAHSSDGDSTVIDKDNDDYDDYDDYDDGCEEYLSSSSSSSAKKMGGAYYLGTRRDRQGKWVRRHFSRTRFPHLAKSMQSSSSMSMQSSSSGRQQTARSSLSSDRCGRNQSTITKYTRKNRNTRQKKVVISKGRRALLRVSARAYEDRKQRQPSFSLFYSTPDNDYEFESIPTTSTFQSTNPSSTSNNTNTDFDYFHPIKNRQEAFSTNSSSSCRLEDRIGNNNLTYFEEEDELLHGHYYTDSPPGGETNKNRSTTTAILHNSRLSSRSSTHSSSLPYNTTNINSQSTATKSHNSSRLSSSSRSNYNTSSSRTTSQTCYTSNNNNNDSNKSNIDFDTLSKNRSEESANSNASMLETSTDSPGETTNNVRRRRSKRVTNARSTILQSLRSHSRHVSSSLHNATATTIDDDDDDIWNEAIDPISGETYYYNQATGESSWERPSSNTTTDCGDIAHPASKAGQEEEVFATKSSSPRPEKKIEKLAFESENELYGTEINNRGRRALRGITIAGSSSTSHNNRHSSSIITKNDSENEERIRRFQEAFNAIILATNANFVDQNDDDEASVSTSWLNAGGKRWRRDPNVSSAVSIDGRMYDDMQRAPTASFLKQLKNPGDHAELMDRAATWLVHVPMRRKNNSRLTSVAEENNAVGEHGAERGEVVVSACHQKLSDIESTIHEIENESNFVRMQNNLPTSAMAQGHGSSSSPLKRLSIQSNGEGNDAITPPLFGYARGERKLTAKFSKELMGIHSKDCRIEGGGARSEKLTAKICKELMGVDNSGGSRMERGDVIGGELTTTNPSEEKVRIHPGDGRIEQGYSRRDKLDAIHSSKEFMGVNSEDDDRIGEYDKNSNSNIEFTPSVGRISALKRLFAGVQKETSSSSKNHAPTTKTPIHPRGPNPTMARGRGGDSNPSYMKRTYNKITDAEEKEIDANGRFVYDLRNEKGCVGSSSMGADLNEANASERDDVRNNSLGLLESKALGTVDCEETNKISCKNDDLPAEHIFEGQDHLHDGMFDSLGDQSHLNLENLIRESLVTRLPSVIDTDGTESDIADLDEEQYAAKMRSMLMSPSLITKRYQQALTAIEVRNWTQISSLINANPWLMEMEDVRNDQSLVHSLSLFGGLQNDADHDSPESTQSLPEQLVQNIIDHIPNVVYKLDIEGNLPLHMAAASGNIVMIRELGRRFSGGASVQNHNGLLPLHLAIMSCALSFPTGSQSVELLLALFPGAVRVKDNDGNTPLHVAAGTLRGDVGADVIYQLMNECYALMVESEESLKVSMTCATPVTEEASTASAATGILPVESESDPSFFTMKNNKGETPLTRAIKSLAGRQVVEALLFGVGGQSAALNTNSASQNALHLALSSEYYDAAVILSILKSSPTTATAVDGKGMLPIQVACLNSAQHEIILAIAIVDLPIDLGAKEEAIMRDGFGESWWYLLCETDDLYVDVITEVLLLCSHPQKVALCLTQAGGEDDSQIASTCATSQCKLELRRCLRFFGRFEFVGSGGENHVLGVQKFDAIDYGTREAPIQDGKKVNLYCYTDAMGFSKNAEHLQHSALDTKLFEKLSYFSVGEMEANVPSGVSLQYCVAVDKPNLRLSSVMAGMPNDHKYRSDLAILGRYFRKSRSIMRQIAKALCQLHAKTIIHGHLDSHHIGKFGERWKVIGLPGSAVGGEQFETSRLGLHSPPEAYVSAHSKHSDGLSIASLAPSLKAEPAVDIWAFGKLMYEIFVGEPLFRVFSERDDSVHASKCILTWNDGHLRDVSNKLFEERIGPKGVDLISCCLRPMKSARTRSMAGILQHPFWRDDNAFNLS